jgi:hypothetical protein
MCTDVAELRADLISAVNPAASVGAVVGSAERLGPTVDPPLLAEPVADVVEAQADNERVTPLMPASRTRRDRFSFTSAFLPGIRAGKPQL